MRQYRILIIDDEAIIVTGLKQLVPWDEINCEIVGSAKNGEEGLIAIETLHPDLVISDIRMPKLTGLEMIKALKAKKNDVKFIILTGYREFEYAREAINLGVTKFLLKPTNIEDIKQAVLEATTLLDEERERDEDIRELRNRLSTVDTEESTAVKDEQDIQDPGNINYLAHQAINYIKENYMQKLELQNVADALFISPWYLCKILKKEVGNSFIQLLNEIRIEEAKKCLTKTNDKIYEISELVGYQDVAYFNKIFKKYTDMTPAKFRNTYFAK